MDYRVGSGPVAENAPHIAQMSVRAVVSLRWEPTD